MAVPRPKKPLHQDFFAGITVSFVAVSLGAAFGLASGRKDGALIGIASSAVIALVTSAFGGTRIQCSGPTAPMTAVVAPIVMEAQTHLAPVIADLGVTPDQFLNAVLIVTGCLLVAMGILRLGHLIRYVPNSVISGFMNGIAVLILRAEVGKLFGILGHASIGGPALINVSIALSTLALCFVAPKITKILPGTLLAIVVVTAAVQVIGLSEIEFTHIGAISSVSDLKDKFSGQIPSNWSFALVQLALPRAFELAVLAYLDTLLTSLVVDKLVTRLQGAKEETAQNQELAAQGLANASVALFGGIPGAQATIRSVLILKEGATRRVAGVLVGVFALVEMLLLQGLIHLIPKAVFSGVLLKVGSDVVDWDPLKRFCGRFASPCRGPAWQPIALVDFLLIAGTTLSTVMLDLNAAVLTFTVLFYVLRLRMDVPDLEAPTPPDATPAKEQIQLV